MDSALFFILACGLAIVMGRIMWRALQAGLASLALKSELRIHWRKIYPGGKNWDYFWSGRKWRKILSEEFLLQHPDLENALAKYERQSSRYGRELFCFTVSILLITLVGSILVFVLAINNAP